MRALRALVLALAAAAAPACALIAGIEEHHLAPSTTDAQPPSPSSGPDGGLPGNEAQAPDAATFDAAPIAFIQAAHAQTMTSDTATVTLAQPLLDHHTVIVALDIDTTPVGDVADPQVSDGTNTYTKVLDAVNGAEIVYLYVASNVTAGPAAVTVKLDHVIAEIEAYVTTYSGLLGPPTDSDKFITTQCADEAVDCVKTKALRATARQSLLYAYSSGYKIQHGTGFDARDTFNSNLAEDRIVPAGSYPATATKFIGPTAIIIAAIFPAP